MPDPAPQSAIFPDPDRFVALVGEDECLQIAGLGGRDARTLDRPRIIAAIAHAHAVVMGYVADRWPQARAGTPLLEGFVVDLARQRLRSRGGPSSAMSEVVDKRADEVLRHLRDLQAGRMALDLPAAADVAGAVDGDAGAVADHAILGMMTEGRAAGLAAGYRGRL